MVFKVEDGKLTGVKGNPDHPMTRGGLSVKLKDYEQRHYQPDRLLYPMRRTGPKGSKQFERISWIEATVSPAQFVRCMTLFNPANLWIHYRITYRREKRRQQPTRNSPKNIC